MNRKLKFRVWDSLEEKFYYPDKGYQGHYVLSLDGKFTNLQNGAGGSECIVMQFTGCLDKNNKEIYEGDLVKVTSSYSNENYIATVIYGEAEFCFKVNDGDIKGCWSGDDVEVVGKVVPFDKALNEPPPSKELDSIMKQIISIDEERKAWKHMFELQVKLVADLELQKLKMQENYDRLKEEVELYKKVNLDLRKELTMCEKLIKLNDENYLDQILKEHSHPHESPEVYAVNMSLLLEEVAKSLAK